MKDGLKKSKYTWMQQGCDGSLILYNSLHSSLHKITDKKTKITVNDILSNDKLIQKEDNSEILDKLYANGYIIPEYCDEKLLIRQKIRKEINRPILELCIIPTQQCNFRCSYCFENVKNAPKGVMSEDVQDAIADYVKKHISRYVALSVTWFGGEPLLALPVIERLSSKFLEICSLYKKPYYADISTNGYFLTTDIFQKLLDNHIREIQITLDGTREIHNQQRCLVNGEGSFDIILKNLVNIKNNFSEHFFINIRTNYSNKMYTELEDFLILLDRNFYPDERFKIYFTLIKNMGGNFNNEINKWIALEDEIQLAQRIIKLLPHKELYLNEWVTARLLNTTVCSFVRENSIAFDNNGEIYKCSTYFQTFPQTKIGNIYKNRVYIDQYKKSSWLLDGDMVEDKCDECLLLPVCNELFCPAGKVIDCKRDSMKCRWRTLDKPPWERLIAIADELNIIKKF